MPCSARLGVVGGEMPPIVLALLVFALPSASAGLATDFANDFAIPLYESFGGCKESLQSIIKFAVQADDSWFTGCLSPGGECDFGDFAGAAAGLVFAPIITIFICCGFCCGRCFSCCKCCCSPCGQEACGGGKPTKAQYPGWEQSLTWAILAVSWIAVFSFSIVGYIAFVDLKGNWNGLVDGTVDLFDSPNELATDITNSITNIKDSARDFINQDVNPLFDRLMVELRILIEGCDITEPGYTGCRIGSEDFHSACTGTQTEHYTTGEGVLMGNGQVAPNCWSDVLETPGPCPCCTECTQIIADIDDVLSQLPTNERIDELDQPLDVTQIDEDLDNALGDWDSQLDQLEESNEPLQWLRDNEDDVRGWLGSGRVEGVALLFFVFSWLICTLILAACGLNVAMRGTSDLPGYIWWTAFVIGSFQFILIICPFFGIFSLIGLPFGAVCAADLSPSPNPTDVDKFLDGCLFDGTKYIWPLIDTDPPIDKASILDNLAAFDARENIDEGAIDDVLNDVDAYTEDYNKEDIDALEAEEGNYGITQDCTAFLVDALDAGSQECQSFQGRMAQYQQEIDTRVQAIQALGTAVEQLIENTKTAADDFKGDIDQVFLKTDELLADIVDEAWEVGKCDRFNNLFLGLANPFDGMTDVVVATWAALFMIGIFMPFLLCSMCHGAKLLYRARHPEDYVEGGTHMKADGDEGVMGGEFSHVVPPMGAADANMPPIEPSANTLPPTMNPMNPPGMGVSTPSAHMPPMSPQTMYTEERPYSEANVKGQTAPVFFDAYNGAAQGPELDLYGGQMYGQQNQTHHVYPYVDQGMA